MQTPAPLFPQPPSILPWLKLQAVSGIGPLRFSKLMAAFGNPDAAFRASTETLCRIAGISPHIAQNMKAAARLPDSPFLREMALAQAHNVQIIGLGMPGYPELLAQIPDPPPVLYVKGTLPRDAVAVAVIGSRNATRYGKDNAFSIAADLAKAGVVVVSGLARGIDTAAHEGTLSAGGQTLAIMGCGLSHVYPGENRPLSRCIEASGALVSPFSMETPPDAPNFPARNRIISGLCLGTAVIEAADRSGSLITARLAAEQGREVFALPGNVRSMKSAGTHRLLREGACLVEKAEDILNELNIVQYKKERPDPQPPENSLALTETTVLKALDAYPIHIDTLSIRTGMAAGPLSATLFALELQGKVVQHPGKYFVKP